MFVFRTKEAYLQNPLNIEQQLKLLRVMSRVALGCIPLGYCTKQELTAVAFLLLPFTL